MLTVSTQQQIENLVLQQVLVFVTVCLEALAVHNTCFCTFAELCLAKCSFQQKHGFLFCLHVFTSSLFYSRPCLEMGLAFLSRKATLVSQRVCIFLVIIFLYLHSELTSHFSYKFLPTFQKHSENYQFLGFPWFNQLELKHIIN